MIAERSLLWERFDIDLAILLVGMCLKIEVFPTTTQVSEVHLQKIFLTVLLVRSLF